MVPLRPFGDQPAVAPTPSLGPAAARSHAKPVLSDVEGPQSREEEKTGGRPEGLGRLAAVAADRDPLGPFAPSRLCVRHPAPEPLRRREYAPRRHGRRKGSRKAAKPQRRERGRRPEMLYTQTGSSGRRSRPAQPLCAFASLREIKSEPEPLRRREYAPHEGAAPQAHRDCSLRA